MTTENTTLLTSGEPSTSAGEQQTAEGTTTSSGGEATTTNTEVKTDGVDGAAQAESKETKAPDVPEVYEFKAPEGGELDKTAVEQFTPLAKELGLSQASAQKLVDFYANAQKAQAETHAKTTAEWEASVRTDKEIGGDKLTETLASTSKVMATFGTPALKTYLEATGLGNHPELVRFVAKIGKSLSQDTFVKGGATTTSETDAAKVLFPSMN